MVFSSEKIIQGLTPEVLISKITLETTNMPKQVGVYENPHIDNDKTPEIQRDIFTGKRRVFSLGNDLTSKGTSNKLKVTVQLLLKEKFSNDLIGNFFKDKDFSKYIKINVIQCLKNELTKNVSQKGSIVSLLSPKTFRKVDNNNKSFLLKQLQIESDQKLSQFIDKNIETQTLSLKNLKTNIRKDIDVNGNTVLNSVITTTFSLKHDDPEHLSYFAYSFIDVEELAKDFNFNIESNLFSLPIGRIVSDVVIHNNSIVGHSYVFVDEQNNIWTGPITQNGTNFFGLKNKTKIPLNPLLMDNSKIEDFRDFNDIEKLELNFSTIENELSNVNLNKLTSLHATNDNIFSDFLITRDNKGNARFLFAINFLKALKDNCKYPKIFSNNNLIENVKESSIISMKIFRRRIKGSPEIGTSYDLNQLFDSNQVDELLIQTGEKSYKKFNINVNSKAAIKEIKDISIPNNNKLFNSGIRFFSGVDKEMPDITDGYYVYGLELEIIDPSFTLLLNKTGELKKAKAQLEQYFLDGSKLTSSKIIRNNDPHIDFPGEIKLDRFEVSPGNFDVNLNRFTKEFINEQKRKYLLDSNKPLETPWDKAIKTYLNCLELVSTNITLKQKNKFLKTLTSFCHPATGNLKGIQKVINLMEQLEAIIIKAIGASPNITASLSFSSDSPSMIGQKLNSVSRTSRINNSESSRIKTFKLTKFFDNVYNSNVNKSIGFDFLNIDDIQDSLTGIKLINGEQYKNRVDREIETYFVRQGGINPDINISHKEQIYTQNDSIDNTSFSYLTPAKISVGEKVTISRIGHSPTPQANDLEYSTLDLAIKNLNYSKEPIKTTSSGNKRNLKTLEQHLVQDTTIAFQQLGIEPVIATTTRKLTLSDIIPSDINARSTVVIDPIVKDNSVCDKEDGTDNYHETVSRAIPALLQLTRMIKTDNVGIKKIPSAEKAFTKERVSLKNFDLTHADNNINKLLKEPTLYKAESFFQGLPHNTTLDFALGKLPNQIKSLYLGKLKPNAVRKNWYNEKNDPLLSTEKQTEFKLSYNMINTVQVLMGFKQDDKGNYLLKHPLWQPLTLKLYNESVGDALICKLIPYENKLLGIHRDKTIELPLFDEYFLLSPVRKASSIDVPNFDPSLTNALKKKANIEEKTIFKIPSIYERDSVPLKMEKHVSITINSDSGISAGFSDAIDLTQKQNDATSVGFIVTSNPPQTNTTGSSTTGYSEYMGNNIVNDDRY